MSSESINDLRFDGEAMEELRPLLQIARRCWARYRSSDLDRLAAALEGGEVLEELRSKLAHGQFGQVLAWLNMAETTARRWRALYRTGLTAAEVIECGGMSHVLSQVDLEGPENAKTATADTPVAEIQKDSLHHTIASRDNAVVQGGSQTPDRPQSATSTEPEKPSSLPATEPPAAPPEEDDEEEAKPPQQQPAMSKKDARIWELEIKLGEALAKVEAVESELRDRRNQGSEYSHERQAEIRRMNSIIAGQTASIGDLQMQLRDEKRRANYWERQAKALGWKPAGES